MTYWELNLPAAALVIASLLFVAITIGALCGWAPEDDSERENEAMGIEPRAQSER